MSIIKHIQFIGVLGIVTVSFLLPSELRKPVSDGLSLRMPKVTHKDIKVANIASFELKDPVPISPQDYVKIEAKKYGWSEGKEWNSLSTLIKNESGWRTHARNASGACGLFQALPCSKLGAPLDDVSNQAKWGLGYIEDYGSPSIALKFWHCTGSCYSPRAGKVIYKSTTWY